MSDSNSQQADGRSRFQREAEQILSDYWPAFRFHDRLFDLYRTLCEQCCGSEAIRRVGRVALEAAISSSFYRTPKIVRGADTEAQRWLEANDGRRFVYQLEAVPSDPDWLVQIDQYVWDCFGQLRAQLPEPVALRMVVHAVMTFALGAEATVERILDGELGELSNWAYEQSERLLSESFPDPRTIERAS